MRVALGSLAGGLAAAPLYDYPYPRGSFTLVNGKVIADPASQQPTGDDCLPYKCGVAGDDAVLGWCSFYGQPGALPGCVHPDCAPYRDMIRYCTLPQVPGTDAQETVNAIPTLTPENIVQPLPDITVVLQPQPVFPDCSMWSRVNGAIAEHPVIAIAVLAGFAIAVFAHRKGARR